MAVLNGGSGTPLLRLLAELAATVCVEALTFTALCTRPQASELVSPQAYGELRIATRAALVWAQAVPGHRTRTPPCSTGCAGTTEAWLITAAAAAIVTAGCRIVLSWQAVFALAGHPRPMHGLKIDRGAQPSTPGLRSSRTPAAGITSSAPSGQ
ncbi:MAG: hypothetical protein DLM60_12035 [Pseudonocardiales bacterium]|nr:hypothetical protein [Actinomycetota bacterium]PZS18388.1 MAG: hypothetical protein DLM60_12035 [Pseudonocardiales bacterium]